MQKIFRITIYYLIRHLHLLFSEKNFLRLAVCDMSEENNLLIAAVCI